MKGQYLIAAPVLVATLVGGQSAVAEVPRPAEHSLNVRRLRVTNRCFACDLSGVDLSGLHLIGADLRSANLQGTDLSRTNLEGADLGRADLTHANLTRAFLTNASLASATLDGVNFSQAHLYYVDVTGASMQNLNLAGAEIVETPISVGGGGDIGSGFRRFECGWMQ